MFPTMKQTERLTTPALNLINVTYVDGQMDGATAMETTVTNKTSTYLNYDWTEDIMIVITVAVIGCLFMVIICMLCYYFCHLKKCGVYKDKVDDDDNQISTVKTSVHERVQSVPVNSSPLIELR